MNVVFYTISEGNVCGQIDYFVCCSLVKYIIKPHICQDYSQHCCEPLLSLEYFICILYLPYRNLQCKHPCRLVVNL